MCGEYERYPEKRRIQIIPFVQSVYVHMYTLIVAKFMKLVERYNATAD